MADRKTAEQIMKRKAVIRAEIERHLPKEQADALWQQATERLASIMARYTDLPEGLRPHTDARIFPSAAIYLTAKERVGQKTAYGFIEDAAVALTGKTAIKLAKLLRLPGIAFERTGTLGKGAQRCDFCIRKA